MRQSAEAALDHESLSKLVAEHRAEGSTMQELILRVVREGLLAGYIPPSAKLRQDELASLFGTSRIPVREALRVLEREGLVVSEPNRGFRVTQLDADEIEEIYELRGVLEGHAVRLAISLMTQSDLDDLEVLYQDMIGSVDNEDRVIKRDRYKQRVFAITARPRLIGLIEMLRNEVVRSLRYTVIDHSVSDHDVFFAAIKNGDADLAVAELTSHYRKIGAQLRRRMREAKLAGGYR